MNKSKSRLDTSEVIFFCCDMQSSFNDNKVSYAINQALESCMFMIEVSNIFKIPIIVSQHDPKVFGDTISEIKNLLPKDAMVYQKRSFSMVNQDCVDLLEMHIERKTVIIFGIETHCCIQQTCLDLLDRGYDVHVVTDATTSSRCMFRAAGLVFLAQQGCLMNTSQGVFYELWHDDEQPQTDQCLKLLLKYPGNNMIDDRNQCIN